VARRLCVVQLLPALNAGGVERSTLEIGRALVAAGHRSVVISAGGRLVEALQAESSEHIALSIGAKSPATLFKIPALHRLLRELAPDIVHARSRLPAWLALAALRGLQPRPRFVTTAHGLNSPGRYSAVMTRGERVICVSETVRAYLLQHYPRLDPQRLAVIPRGIEPSAFPAGLSPSSGWRRAFIEAFPQLDGGPLLTLPGRGTRIKGHAEAIRLLAGLAGRGIEARLLLLGAAEPGREAYVDELQALAVELGVAHRLAISPARADVAEVYAISRLVLQTSTKPEAFGRTVIEALHMGVPVLGFEHGGVGELLRELYPVGAVPLGDEGALLDAAQALLENAPPVLAFPGYRLQDMQQATLALYAELLESPA
jgi:glycosyltransferase involved in cell wall biosynthesis